MLRVKRKSVKERQADERDGLLAVAKDACSRTSARVGPTGTTIADGTAYMLKAGVYYVLSPEKANRFQTRMKWRKI